MLVLSAIRTSPVAACSCIPAGPLPGFLLSSDQRIPRNVRGLLWYAPGGEIGQSTRFSVTHISGHSETRLGFRLVPIEPSRFVQIGRLYLIEPTTPLVIGERYRFSSTLEDDGHERTVSRTVEVAATALQLPDKLNVAVSSPSVGELAVNHQLGRCSARVRAAQVQISIALPAALEEFREQLIYLSLADGVPWHPHPGNCQYVMGGRSWRPAGKDLFYALCTPDWQVQRGLDLGSHQVQMKVWFPGRSGRLSRISSPVTVALHCQ